jgi:hypothetical protein
MSRPMVVIGWMIAPPNRGSINSINSIHIHGTQVPVEEPSTAPEAVNAMLSGDVNLSAV